MKLNKNNILKGVKNSWIKILNTNNLIDALEKINSLNKNNIYPLEENILRTFKYFEVNETKLIILGQDPYHNTNNLGIPQANGFAFSVNNNFKIPPSLKNIYKELNLEYKDFIIPTHGNLIDWVKKEKILLLNCSLTVEKNNPGCHIKIWENYTNEIIKYISNNTKNTIFILFGNFAKKKLKLMNDTKIKNNEIKILQAVHPSPLSANKGFFNSNIFKNVNNYIKLIQSNKRLCIIYIKNKNNIDIKIIKNIIKYLKNMVINFKLK